MVCFVGFVDHERQTSKESHHAEEADNQQSQRSSLILKSESAAMQRADRRLINDSLKVIIYKHNTETELNPNREQDHWYERKIAHERL